MKLSLKSDNNAIKVNKLTKKYFLKSQNKEIIALDEVSFSIDKGSMVALLGPNGAGKSTLINILAGITNKSSGKAFINGFDLDKSVNKAKLSIGVVPQELVMDPYFTPRETLNFQSGYYGLKKENYLTEYLLNKLKLEDKSDAYVRYLSGGMKRRLQIAKALIHDPEILILDEPTAGVDIELRYMLWDFLKKINSEGKTILLTTHYIEEAEHLCDRIAIIDNGTIIVDDTTSNLKEKNGESNILIECEENVTNFHIDNVNFTIDKKSIFINTKNPNKQLPIIMKTLSDLSLSISNIEVKKSNLEQVFLKLTNK